MPTPEQLEQWQKLWAAATPGPLVWCVYPTEDKAEQVERFAKDLSHGSGRVHYVGKLEGDDSVAVVALTGNGPTGEVNAHAILAALEAGPQLIEEVRSLREELRAYQVEELRRRMSSWSEDWYAAGWFEGLAAEIWNNPEDREETPDMFLHAIDIVKFGRSIDAWITDDGQALTIAEWEARLAIGDS